MTEIMQSPLGFFVVFIMGACVGAAVIAFHWPVRAPNIHTDESLHQLAVNAAEFAVNGPRPLWQRDLGELQAREGRPPYDREALRALRVIESQEASDALVLQVCDHLYDSMEWFCRAPWGPQWEELDAVMHDFQSVRQLDYPERKQ